MANLLDVGIGSILGNAQDSVVLGVVDHIVVESTRFESVGLRVSRDGNSSVYALDGVMLRGGREG